MKFIDAEIRHIPNLIGACCVLHNICVMEKECVEDQIGDADGGEEGGGDDGQGEGRKMTAAATALKTMMVMMMMILLTISDKKRNT